MAGRSGIEGTVEFYPEEASPNSARVDQLLHDVYRDVDRDREPDAIISAGTACNRRIQANDFPAEIDQRSAAIAGIDGSIGLDEVLVKHLSFAQVEVAASLGTDDASSHTLTQIEWTAECQDDFSHFRLAAVTNPRGCQIVPRDGQDGHIRFGICPDLLDLNPPAVCKIQVEMVFVRMPDDMAIGQYIGMPIDIHQDSRTRLFQILMEAELG